MRDMVYKKILLDLRSDKNVGTGLTNILENMTKNLLLIIIIILMAIYQ